MVVQPPIHSIDVIAHIRRTQDGHRLEQLLAAEGLDADGGYQLVDR